jgi:hypothetical protein
MSMAISRMEAVTADILRENGLAWIVERDQT